MLHISEADVRACLDMPTAMSCVAEAFRQLAQGGAMNVPRQRAKAPGIVLHSMSAAADYLGLVGWKCYTTTAQGARFDMGVYDQTSGALVALIEADWLGRIRTGAVTGVAMQKLTPEGAASLGLFGTGKQAETQLLAVCTARPVRQAYVYSRDEGRRTDFAKRMTAELNARPGAEPVTVTPTADPRQAASQPMVVTCTTSRTPVLEASWLKPGACVAAVGSNSLQRTELDLATIARAEQVVCDSVAACRPEAGDFAEALAAGSFSWAQAIEISDVLFDRQPVDTRPQTWTVFKSVGMAIEDLAVAAHVLAQVRLRRK